MHHNIGCRCSYQPPIPRPYGFAFAAKLASRYVAKPRVVDWTLFLRVARSHSAHRVPDSLQWEDETCMSNSFRNSDKQTTCTSVCEKRQTTTQHLGFQFLRKCDQLLKHRQTPSSKPTAHTVTAQRHVFHHRYPQTNPRFVRESLTERVRKEWRTGVRRERACPCLLCRVTCVQPRIEVCGPFCVYEGKLSTLSCHCSPSESSAVCPN